MKRCEVSIMGKKKQLVTKLISYGLVILAFVFCELKMNGTFGWSMSRSMKGQLIPICVYISMAVSLNLVVGFSGELSLGHAGFMSIGAFTGVVVSGYLLNAFSMQNEVLRLVIAMAAGGLLAGIFGFLIGIPVLRLKGDYLAIVTLAFGEIIKNIINCVYISVDGKRLLFGFDNPDLAGVALLAGPQGTVKVAKIATFGAGFILVLITLFVVLNLAYSQSGRAIMACRDSRIAAESVGVNPTHYKMMAFVTAAVLAGMAGAVYGLSISNIKVAKFDYNQSILILVYVVLGGIGNVWGSIISSTVLVMLPTLLQNIKFEAFGTTVKFDKTYMLWYAVLLIAVMLISNSSVGRWIRYKISKLTGKKKAKEAQS